MKQGTPRFPINFRPLLDRKALEATVRGHLKGDRNYTTEIRKLLSIELLHRLFVDSRN